MSFTDYFCWNCRAKLLNFWNAQWLNDSHAPTRAHTFLIKKLKWDEGDLCEYNKFTLLVPGQEKGLEQPGGSLSPPPPNWAFLYALVSPTHKCMHTRTHTNSHAHTRPTQRWQRHSPASPTGWWVPWNLSWSLGCIQEDSKPCENCPTF